MTGSINGTSGPQNTGPIEGAAESENKKLSSLISKMVSVFSRAHSASTGKLYKSIKEKFKGFATKESNSELESVEEAPKETKAAALKKWFKSFVNKDNIGKVADKLKEIIGRMRSKKHKKKPLEKPLYEAKAKFTKGKDSIDEGQIELEIQKKEEESKE